jgi:micrococcal nuclease
MASKKKNLFVRRKLAAVAAGTILLVAGTVGVVKRAITPGETVTAVIDGDSFKIGNDQTIRLLSLNAPDIKYCMGKEAKDALAKKILGKRVILKELETDRYGRVMAMTYLGDGENVNEFMIKNGLAIHLWDSSTQLKILGQANDFAREERLGIFSPKCYQTTPPNPKCAIKGSINPATKEKTYTLPDCDRYALTVVEKYKGEDWYCTEKEAQKAGYVKSDNCK